MSMYPIIGQIILWPGASLPNGWLPCDGRTLLISNYPILFQVLSNRFGGDGVSTFSLPDLRGRVPVGVGQGSGLTDRLLAATGGEERHVLTLPEMPEHQHSYWYTDAVSTIDVDIGADATVNGVSTSSWNTGAAGGGQPHNNMPPFLVMQFIIAARGGGVPVGV